MKKTGILFAYLTAGLAVIILIFSLIYSISPLDFFKFVNKNRVAGYFYVSALYFVILTSVWLKSKDEEKGPLTFLGLSAEKFNPLQTGISVVIAALIFYAYFLIMNISKTVTIKSDPGHLLKLLTSSLALGLMFSFIEEIMFRGFILQTLIKERGIVQGFVMANAIFAFLHIFRPGGVTFKIVYFIGIFSIGCALSYIYVKTGSLWNSIGVHTIWITGMYFLSEAVKYNVDNYKRFEILWGLRETPAAGFMGILLVLLTALAIKTTDDRVNTPEPSVMPE